MTKKIQWVDNSYSSTLQLTKGLQLKVFESMRIKSEPLKYSASFFGLRLKKTFDTEEEAQKEAEAKAWQILKNGLSNLEELLK